MPGASAGNIISAASQVGAGVITTTGILDGTIANADISASAAIAIGKLSGVAASGANNDITSLTGLSTKITTAQGGLNLDTSAAAQGGILYLSATGVWSVLVPGTSGYFLKTQGASANPTWVAAPGAGALVGNFSQAINDTTTVTIPHGLGRTPTFFQLFGLGIGSTFQLITTGAYDGTNQRCSYAALLQADATPVSGQYNNIAVGKWDATDYILATVAWDATNVTITWAITGSTAARTVNYTYVIH